MSPSSYDDERRCGRADFPTWWRNAAEKVVGFAYASPFRVRPAYRHTVEDSVYVHRDATGTGVGRRLLRALVDACEAAGCRQLVAVIGGADERSVGFHRHCGFEEAGPDQGRGLEARPLARPRADAAHDRVRDDDAAAMTVVPRNRCAARPRPRTRRRARPCPV